MPLGSSATCVETLPSFLGLTVVACAHCPSLHALRLELWCGLGSGTPPQDILSCHSTLERQSLFESHRQRRWLTSWSYKAISVNAMIRSFFPQVVTMAE